MKSLRSQYKVLTEKELFNLNGGYSSSCGGSGSWSFTCGSYPTSNHYSSSSSYTNYSFGKWK